MLVLGELMSAISGSFHRVLAVLMQNCMAAQGRKRGVAKEHLELVKAANDYAPPLVLIAVWIEHHIRKNEISQNGPTVVYKSVRPSQSKTEAESSWVEIAASTLSDSDGDVVLDPQLEKQNLGDENALLKTLRSSQKSVLSIVTDLIANAMKMGGAESSTHLWRNVVAALRDSTSYTGGKKSEAANELSRDMLCRLTAVILTKAQNERSFEWEMWSAPLCGAVARVCDMIEEKDLLKRPSDGSPHSRDQILLEAALVDLLSYGREMTGWCQLTLPAPPEPNLQLAQGGSLEVPEETVFFDGAESLDMTDVGGGIVEGPSGVEDALDGGRQYFVPPQVPGASSKVMLPILQPAFRVAMASLGSIDPAVRILIPSAINEAKDTDSFQTMSLFLHLVEELKLTLVAAIVGLSFPSARDVALHGMTSLRHILSEQPIDGSDSNAIMSELFASLVEEIRARYEGERRRREQALFDAYDDEGESGDDEAESSQEVERMILGGDLIPSVGSLLKPQETEEITFDAGERKPEKATVLDGAEDFVMFHETYENMFNAKPGNAQLGWDQYKVRSPRLIFLSHVCVLSDSVA